MPRVRLWQSRREGEAFDHHSGVDSTRQIKTERELVAAGIEIIGGSGVRDMGYVKNCGATASGKEGIAWVFYLQGLQRHARFTQDPFQ